MSLYGIRGSTPGIVPNGATPSAPLAGGQAQSRIERRQVVPANQPLRTAPPAAAPATMPVHPPPGTDPELWSVLSGEERSYFAKLGAMGPLTYGRVLGGQSQPQPPVARGGRLDVKA